MFLKPLKKRLIAWVGPWLTYWTIKILGRTVRFEVINPEIPKLFWERGTPFLLVFWHGRLLMILHSYEGKKVGFLASPHRDGQVVGKALQRFGFQMILGSTTRKGFSAFKKMLKALQNGLDIAVTPDGPRGPRYKAQIGVIELSRLTGRSIIPVTFGASRKIIIKTWDRFLLPYPFSRGVFIWGEPIHVDPNGDRDHLEEKRFLLENRLNEITEQADHYFDSYAPGKGVRRYSKFKL
jgi:lysophospholipid acyltransferase (LPLAT)-like uncharacterized protein